MSFFSTLVQLERTLLSSTVLLWITLVTLLVLNSWRLRKTSFRHIVPERWKDTLHWNFLCYTAPSWRHRRMQAVQDSEVVGNDTWTGISIGLFVRSLLIWTWVRTALPIRSDPLRWPGSGGASAPWNQSKSLTQCGPTYRSAGPTWTALQLHGYPLYQSLLDRTTPTTMSTGPPCPGTKKSLSSPLDSSCSPFCCTEPSVRILLISFFEQASKRCPATTAKCSLFSGLCSQARNRTFCGMPSTTGPFPLRKASVNHPTTRRNDDYDLTDRPGLTPGRRLCTALSQSLPGPDSRDESTVPLLQIQERSLVDVQVGGLVGQQPPEAESKRFPGSLFKGKPT